MRNFADDRKVKIVTRIKVKEGMKSFADNRKVNIVTRIKPIRV